MRTSGTQHFLWAATVLLLALPTAAFSAPRSDAPQAVVIQVSEASPANWNLALNNAENVPTS